MSVQSFLSNLVSETTETQGTVDYVLEGPATGRRAFRDRFANGKRAFYVAQQIQRDGNDDITAIYFEAGLGTLTHGSPDTIARTAVIDSSNGGSAVDWGPGTKTIWCAAPGEMQVLLDAALTAAKEGRPLIVNPTSDGFTIGNPSLGQQAASELTIASGSITPTRAFHTVDTESDEATDDLVTVATTNIADGGILLLTAADAGRTVVVKHAASPSAGQIFLLSGADFALDDATKCIALQRRGDHWVEVWRGSGKVALSDMADLAANKLLGRATGSTGAPEEVGLGNGLEMDPSATVVRVPASKNPIQGSVKALKIVSADAGTSSIITADAITLEDAGGYSRRFKAVSETVNLSTSGAGGLDTGSVATSTWYSLWVIAKEDGTIDGLASTSATAPTMPSGYTYKARVGWVRTKSGSAVLKGAVQYGPVAQYTEQQQIAGGSGAVGSATVPTYVEQSVAAFVPSTAREIAISAAISGAGSALILAPNGTGYGASVSTTNPPFIDLNQYNSNGYSRHTSMVLETLSVYWATNTANGRIFATGWTDNF